MTEMGKQKGSRVPRAKRRANGMADRAGVAKAPRNGEPITRTLSVLNAALRVWEAKRGISFRPTWDHRGGLGRASTAQ